MTYNQIINVLRGKDKDADKSSKSSSDKTDKTDKKDKDD